MPLIKSQYIENGSNQYMKWTSSEQKLIPHAKTYFYYLFGDGQTLCGQCVFVTLLRVVKTKTR